MAAETSKWIFLRGLVRESAHWDKFPQQFERSIPGASVILVDLPGNGRHHKIPSPTSLAKVTDFVRAECRGHGPAFLFSISMGSMVALDWAARYPAEVRGAVLINTSVKGVSPLTQRLRREAWGPLGKLICTASTEARERGILKLTANTAIAGDAEVLKARVRAYEDRPVSRANVFRQLIAAATFDPPREMPKVPLLLLCSEADRLVHPACGEAIARVWKLSRKVHPTAGHDLPLDDPMWTIEKTKAWVAALGA